MKYKIEKLISISLYWYEKITNIMNQIFFLKDMFTGLIRIRKEGNEMFRILYLFTSFTFLAGKDF